MAQLKHTANYRQYHAGTWSWDATTYLQSNLKHQDLDSIHS